MYLHYCGESISKGVSICKHVNMWHIFLRGHPEPPLFPRSSSLAFLLLPVDLFRGAGLLLHLLHLDSLSEEVLRADVKLEILTSKKKLFVKKHRRKRTQEKLLIHLQL